MIRQWRALEIWIERAETQERGYAFDTTPLEDILTRRITPIDREKRSLSELNVIAKVTFGGELFLRSEKEKTGYKGPLFAALPGDLIISKIRVGQGSFCIIGDDLEQVAVSPEYPVYTLDTQRIDPGYLVLVLRTQEFLTQLVGAASGNTTKRRIRPSFFESLRIPLPPLSEQRAIVASYRATLGCAEELEREAEEIEAKAAEAFETALGFDPPKPLPARPVFVASFKDLDRWSHEGILRTTLHLEDKEPKFPIVELGTVGKVSYGLQKSPANRPGTHPRPYLRVANVQRSRLDLAEIKMINVPDEDMPKYRLEDGDVLLCEGNSAELVGRGAIWRNEIPHCVHQNHVLRARMDTSKVIPEFVLSVINLSYGQAYFRSKAKHTTNLASINSKEVSRFPLPLPPLSEQQRLIDKLFRGDKEAERLHQEATATRTRAWTDFETAVYATDEAVKAR